MKRRSTSGRAAASVRELFSPLKGMDRDAAVVLFVVTALAIASYYFGSKRFFVQTFSAEMGDDPHFPLQMHFYWFTSTFLLLLLAPLAVIRAVHRRPFVAFGLGAGDWRTGLRWSALFIAVMLPIVWIASAAPEFQRVYPHAQMVKSAWRLFLMYELALGAYFVGWEFVWRGYMLFGMERAVGSAHAILIQMIPFTLLHFGKPVAETAGAMIAAVALGALALRTRSFWYGVAIHWCVMAAMDLTCTLRFRSGAEGIGWGALRAIVSLFGL